MKRAKSGVSYVVPVWREDLYESVAKPWIKTQLKLSPGELIEVRGESSIFDSLERGRKEARYQYIMYVHDDVRLLTPMNLHREARKAFDSNPKLGMMGPAGKIERKRVPWWLNEGNYVGHWCRRGNRGQLVYQYANTTGNAPFRDVVGDDPFLDWARRTPNWSRFAQAGLVDGFYLLEDTTRINKPWDTKTYGENWHGYDVDRCYLVHSLGLEIMVSPWLFLHDNGGHAGYKNSDPTTFHGTDRAHRRINSEGDALWLSDLDVVNELVREKWGVQ